MTFDELEAAVGQHLEGMTDCPPIAWPNADFTPDGLYVEFRHAPNERVDDTIDAVGAYQFGLFLLTVVTPKNQFSTQANTEAQKIADRFPKALKLSAGTGTVTITAPVSPGTPFPDGAYWRQPLRIAYITED